MVIKDDCHFGAASFSTSNDLLFPTPELNLCTCRGQKLVYSWLNLRRQIGKWKRNLIASQFGNLKVQSVTRSRAYVAGFILALLNK